MSKQSTYFGTGPKLQGRHLCRREFTPSSWASGAEGKIERLSEEMEALTMCRANSLYEDKVFTQVAQEAWRSFTSCQESFAGLEGREVLLQARLAQAQLHTVLEAVGELETACSLLREATSDVLLVKEYSPREVQEGLHLQDELVVARMETCRLVQQGIKEGLSSLTLLGKHVRELFEAQELLERKHLASQRRALGTDFVPSASLLAGELAQLIQGESTTLSQESQCLREVARRLAQELESGR